MPANQFEDAALAALSDRFHPWNERADLQFYLPRVMSARAVLDVGCGTGQLLHQARKQGHKGRLCGIDPAPAMLAQASRRSDIEWILGDLRSTRPDGEFDLVVMTGHAFQVLLDDEELRAFLAAVRRALSPEGRFAFETRNPLVRGWERWNDEYTREICDATGAVVRIQTEVDAVEGELVSFTHTYTSPGWGEPKRSTSRLRFLPRDALKAFLSGAGLAVDEQYGDWTGQSLTDTSPEIITIARCVGAR